MKFLEVRNLDGLVYMIAAVLFGPAILLVLIGLALRKVNKKAAKVFYILATVYVIISLGVCGVLIAG